MTSSCSTTHYFTMMISRDFRKRNIVYFSDSLIEGSMFLIKVEIYSIDNRPTQNPKFIFLFMDYLLLQVSIFRTIQYTTYFKNKGYYFIQIFLLEYKASHDMLHAIFISISVVLMLQLY